jgi:class 3 adenylate cyclase
MAKLPTGTVTFLFTDIEGSTRLVQLLGDRYPSVLDEHRRLLRAAFHGFRGQEIETQGDSFFIAFDRATDAIEAAAAGQRAKS